MRAKNEIGIELAAPLSLTQSRGDGFKSGLHVCKHIDTLSELRPIYRRNLQDMAMIFVSMC